MSWTDYLRYGQTKVDFQMNPMNPVPFIDINTATAQEVFDWCVLSVITQGCPSGHSTDNGRSFICAYEVTDDASGGFVRCAAGLLLNRNLLNEVEDFGLLQEDWDSVVRRTSVSRRHEALINDLQDCHDDAANLFKTRGSLWFVADFVSRARDVALDCIFSTEVLEFADFQAHGAEAEQALNNLQQIGVHS